MKNLFLGKSGAWLALFAIVFTASARGTTLPVSLQTLPLIGGSYSLIFDLINGDATPNNTVTLGGFQYGGGGATGTPMLTGGATGDLASAATLRDSSFFNELLQTFTPGGVFSFTLDTTLNFAGGTPDSLSFFILDNGTGLPVPTVDPSGADAFMEFDLEPSLVIHTFGSDPARTPLSIAAPQIGGSSTAVPEPATIGLFGYAMLACGALFTIGKSRARAHRSSRAADGRECR